MLCSWNHIYPSVSLHTELTLWPESAKPCTFSAKIMEYTTMLPLPTLNIRLPLPKLLWHFSHCLLHAYSCDISPSSTNPLFSSHGYIQHAIGTLAGSFCYCVVALYSWSLWCIWRDSQSCPQIADVSVSALFSYFFMLMVALAFWNRLLYGLCVQTMDFLWVHWRSFPAFPCKEIGVREWGRGDPWPVLAERCSAHQGPDQAMPQKASQCR